MELLAGLLIGSVLTLLLSKRKFELNTTHTVILKSSTPETKPKTHEDFMKEMEDTKDDARIKKIHSEGMQNALTEINKLLLGEEGKDE